MDGQDSMTIPEALDLLEKHDFNAGDGKWLEEVVVGCGPEIQEWQLRKCWTWSRWPDRNATFPGSGARDIGVDAVGQRENGELVAIQCKAKGRNEAGRRHSLTKKDFSHFLASTDSNLWSERWIVTNATPTNEVQELIGPLANRQPQTKIISVETALQRERDRRESLGIDIDPRTEMQETAVKRIVERLENIRGKTRHQGWKADESRGQVIMPCGTGKTRVGFLVADRMVGEGGLACILVPSIGLAAQTRRSWIETADEKNRKLEILMVCSDRTAGRTFDKRDEERSSLAEDPTKDLSAMSDRNIAGNVARSAEEVSKWLMGRQTPRGTCVIISTYQSAHHTAQGIKNAGRRVDLMIGDEAHRTAGIRRVTGTRRKERLRQFTMCHDTEAFPARTRLYMTATPRVYGHDKKIDDRNWEVRTMDDESTFGIECFRLSYADAVERGFLSDYRIIALAMPESARDQADMMARRVNRKRREAGLPETATTSLAMRKLAYGLAISGGVAASAQIWGGGAGGPPAFQHRILQSGRQFQGNRRRSK